MPITIATGAHRLSQRRRRDLLPLLLRGGPELVLELLLLPLGWPQPVRSLAVVLAAPAALHPAAVHPTPLRRPVRPVFARPAALRLLAAASSAALLGVVARDA